MSFKYEAIFSIDLGSAIESVGALMNQLNTAVANDGYEMNLKATAPMPSMILTVDRELTEKEQYQMKTLIESEYVKSFPKWDVRLVSFRRKSGNVQQSVS